MIFPTVSVLSMTAVLTSVTNISQTIIRPFSSSVMHYRFRELVGREMDDTQSRFELRCRLPADGAAPIASRGPSVLMSRLCPALRHTPDARRDADTVMRMRSRLRNRWAFEVTIF